MYLGGLWEVELHDTLKLAKAGFPDKVLGFVVVGVAVNETFVLQQGW